MTDGTTGFHVAPITEDDMFKMKDILQRAADAIVGMSQLSQDVNNLRNTVSELQHDTDKLRSQNNALDEALNYSRSERDRQAADLSQVKAELASAHNEAQGFKLENDKLTLSNEQYAIDLDLTRRAKDDAEFKMLELEDKLATANARIAQATKHISDMASLFQPDEPIKPEPAPEPVYVPPPMYPGAETVHEPVLAEPTPKPSLPDSQDTWDHGYSWDPATRKYWRQGVTPKADGEAIPF